MKVIEELVDYLAREGALSDEDVAWLRAEGFVPQLEEDDTEFYEEDDADFYEDCPLEQLEEEQIQKDLQRKGSLPPASSKGARRKRRQLRNHRSAAQEQRDRRRRLAAERRKENLRQSALPALIACLGHSDPRIVAVATDVLRQVGDVEGLVMMAVAVDKTDTATCAQMSHAMKIFLEHENVAVRQRAVTGLMALGTIAVPGLVNCLWDSEPVLRITAAEALVRKDSPAAEEAILALIIWLESSDAWLRSAAAGTLLQLSSTAAKQAVPLLVTLLKHNDAWVRNTAAETLVRIGPAAADSAVLYLMGVVEAWHPPQLIQVVLTLGRIGKCSPAAVLVLIDLLNHHDCRVRKAVVLALPKCGATAASALPPLTTSLQDTDSDVRHWAADAIREIQAATSSPPS